MRQLDTSAGTEMAGAARAERRSPPGALHVIAGLSLQNGGPSYSVPRLCTGLAQLGAQVEIETVGTDDEISSSRLVRTHPQSFGAFPVLRSMRFSTGLARALDDRVPTVDIVHVHGLWLMPNVHAGRTAARHGRPLVVSPRGMLGREALAFSRMQKRLFWALLQRPAYASTACWHATSEAEYEAIREFGISAPVAIVPNGIDLPELTPKSESRTGRREVLSLGRIHPKKGLERLIRAFVAIESEFPDWRCRIVGPAERGHDEELRALIQSLGAQRISIEPPIYDSVLKAQAYRDADLFVLPTRNENFGITVAEALAMQTPVVSTNGAPWNGLEAEGCGWWIEQGVEPLRDALRLAMELGDAERRLMGVRGRRWMKRDFGWGRIAADMLAVYWWLTAGGKPPSTVRLS